MIPDLATATTLVTASYVAIQNVKLYRKRCEELRGRCLDLLSIIQESTRGLDGQGIVAITDEFSLVIEGIQKKITEWSAWGRLKCVVQQGEMKDGIDRLHRELDGCMMKFNIQANIGTHRNHIDLRSIQERDNAEIRDLLRAFVKNQDEMKQLLTSQSPPVVEEVMENLQTQLRASGLRPVEEKDFKAGLWQLHEQTSRLPPLTDLSGQITLLPSKPIECSSSDIYQGRWLDQQKVALRCPKALDDSPATRTCFERDVSTWRQFGHPNVVPLYGTVDIGGRVYSVSPWMDNGNASTYVSYRPLVDRMKLLYETACGLEYLHEKNIVHGDLRAHNILVSQDDVACLADFGLSKFFEVCDRKLIPSVNASLRWTAPEVLKSGAFTSHSDVWSFGMVCVEILSGRLPFHGKDVKGVERQLENGKHPDRLDSISDEMWSLVLKCWSKSPEARPQMSAVKESLKKLRLYSAGYEIDETATTGFSHSESPSRRPTLKMITTFFGRKGDEDTGRSSIKKKPSFSNTMSTTALRGQESFERTNGHDWRVMDRSSSTHSYATTSSVVHSPSTHATTPSIAHSSPQIVYRPSLKPSPNQLGFSQSSLWDEIQKSPTYTSKAKASPHSRPSTGNSSLRHLPSPDLYDIPDDAHLDDRNTPVISSHRKANRDYQNLVSGQNPPIAGSSRPSTRSSLMDIPPRDNYNNFGRSNDHLNSMSGQGSSSGGTLRPPSRDDPANSGRRDASYDHSTSSQTGKTPRPSTRSSVMDQPTTANLDRDAGYDFTKSMSNQSPSTGKASGFSTLVAAAPSGSNWSNISSPELPPLGIPFLSSSPPRIVGDNFPRSPAIQAVHQRSLTAGSSQSGYSHHTFAIQNATETPHCILNTTSDQVSSGTLEGLVQFLIDGFDSPRHTDYRDVFLIACAEFTSPDGLFQILSRRFVDEENQNAARRVVAQYNILMIISYWLKGGYLTPSQELLYRMKFFCEEIAQLKPAGTLLDRANGFRHIVISEIDKLRRGPSTTLEPGGAALQAAQVTPYDVAIGLTLHEGDHYAALRPSDYMVQLTKRQSAKIKRLYDTNNKIKTWVTESILHFDDVHDRAEVLKFFINTAVECRNMRNFSSATAIASALHSTAVDNLRVTRKALTRNMQGKLSDLYDIINPESNHRKYRDALHAPPTVEEKDICVPWMAFHLKELGKVLRIYPVTIEEDGQHLINFSRYTKFMDRTKEMMYYAPPGLEEYRHQGQLAYILNQLQGIDLSEETDDRLMAKSRSLMLQEASDYRTRKPQLVKLGFDF